MCLRFYEGLTNMQIDYDPQAKAMVIRLRPGEVDDAIEAGKHISADGVPLGLAILFTKRTQRMEDAAIVTVNSGRVAQPG
jgi:hypothetical protein